MTATQPAQRVKLSSPADVVAIVPYLLGYHPQRSLVALSLRGPRRRVGLTLRLDLPSSAGHDAVAAAEVAARLKHDGAATAVLVIYDEAPAGAELPRTGLAAALAGACATRGVAVRDTILVADGRWWSYQCANLACCPPDGTPVAPPDRPGGASAAVAAATYAGLSVLPDRQAVADLIAPVGWVRRASMEQALDRAAQRLVPAVLDDAEPVIEESLRLFDAAVDCYLDPEHVTALTDDAWADLVLRIRLIPVRDEVVGWATGPYADPLREMLLELVRRALPPEDLVPLTVLAWVIYLQGGGTLAGIALDRALRRDPTYGLAQLLDEALRRSVDPRVLRRADLPLRVRRHRPARAARRRRSAGTDSRAG